MGEITKAELRKKLGNINQLQELLFGDQSKEINQKLDLCHQKLDHIESNYQKLQLVIDERLEQLESKLFNQIDTVSNSLNRKLQYFNLTSKEEIQKIAQNLELNSQHSQENIDYLQDSLKTQNANLKAEVAQSKSAIDQEIKILKQQITDKLESNLSELSTGKVSRNDLAEVLFELCLKLKDDNNDLKIANQDVADEELKLIPHVDLTYSEENQ